MKRLVAASVIFILVTLFSAFVPREKFTFGLEDGRCDCCKCGWLSCSECAKRKDECCGMRFQRYTFTPHTTPYVLSLAQALQVDKEKAGVM